MSTKSTILSVRLRDDELKALDHLAGLEGKRGTISRSEMIRFLILQARSKSLHSAAPIKAAEWASDFRNGRPKGQPYYSSQPGAEVSDA